MENNYIVLKLNDAQLNSLLGILEANSKELYHIVNDSEAYEKDSIAKEYLRSQGYLMDGGWCVDDVIGKAEDMGYELSEKDANEILDGIGRTMDAEVGINWYVIESNIDEFIEDMKNDVIDELKTWSITLTDETEKTKLYDLIELYDADECLEEDLDQIEEYIQQINEGRDENKKVVFYKQNLNPDEE